jgi:tetratricopeptide (TPR) repeat protein
LLGKHQQVLDLIQRGDHYLRNEMCHGRGELHHWAAVAAWNLGQAKQAQQFWQRALEISPTLAIVSENLADSRLPVGERRGAWPLQVGEWLGEAERQQLSTITRGEQDEEALRSRLQSLLDRRPELAAVMTNMLRHAGPDACELVLTVAKAIGGGPLVEPLWNFAGGQRGSDHFRQSVLEWLKRNELISAKTCRLWFGGQWQDMILVCSKISWEKQRSYSPQVEELMDKAFALTVSQPAEAEQLLRRAVQLVPDAPDVLNNLAAVLRKQGRNREADEIMRDVAARFPDYLFAQIWQAQQLASQGEYVAARKILTELYQRPTLHVSEFSSVVATLVQLSLREDNLEAARLWLKHLQDVNPDFSQLPILQKHVPTATLAKDLEQGMPSFLRKRKK